MNQMVLDATRLLTYDEDLINEIIKVLCLSGWAYAVDQAGQATLCLTTPDGGTILPRTYNQAGQLIAKRLNIVFQRTFQNGAVHTTPPKQEHHSALGLIATDECHRLPPVENLERPMSFHYIKGALQRPEHGYDPTTRTLTVGRTRPPIATTPGYTHLREWFSGVHVVDEVDRNNLLVFSVAMFCKAAVRELPLLLIDAEVKDTGKSKVATALQFLVHGGTSQPILYTRDEHKFERKIASVAGQPGPNVLLIDNATGGRVSSPLISSAVHLRRIGLDPKFKHITPLFLPVFIFTMNGARVEADLFDKCMLVRMRKLEDRKHNEMIPEPFTYCVRHRLQLLSEVVSLLTDLGQVPVRPDHDTRFFEFEDLCYAIANALDIQINLEPDSLRTVDASVLELNGIYDAYDDDCKEPTLDDLLDVVSREHRLGELRSIYKDLYTYSRTKLRHRFRKWLVNNILNRPLTIDNQRVQFTLTDTDVLKRKEV